MFVRFLRWTRFRYASLFLQKVIEPFDSKDLMRILLCLEALYIENMRVNPIMFLFNVELLPQLRVNDDLLLLWFYLNLFRVYFFVLLSGLLQLFLVLLHKFEFFWVQLVCLTQIIPLFPLHLLFKPSLHELLPLITIFMYFLLHLWKILIIKVIIDIQGIEFLLYALNRLFALHRLLIEICEFRNCIWLSLKMQVMWNIIIIKLSFQLLLGLTLLLLDWLQIELLEYFLSAGLCWLPLSSF